jgi:transcriptional regulator with XRE-family HTH domain
VRDKRDTPPAWLPLFEKRGVRSAQHLSELSGVAVQTVVRLLHGPGEPSRSTLQRVAKVLKVDEQELLRLRGQEPRTPFALPRAADKLNERQRAAVLAVVRAMIDTDPGEQQQVDATPEPPSAPVVPLKRAAMTGRSEGRRRRKVQDEAAEGPQE